MADTAEFRNRLGTLEIRVGELAGRVSALPNLWQILGPLFAIVLFAAGVSIGYTHLGINRLDVRLNEIDGRLRGIEQRFAAQDVLLNEVRAALKEVQTQVQTVARQTGAASPGTAQPPGQQLPAPQR